MNENGQKLTKIGQTFIEVDKTCSEIVWKMNEIVKKMIYETTFVLSLEWVMELENWPRNAFLGSDMRVPSATGKYLEKAWDWLKLK